MRIGRRHFTLVELMVVVAIVMVLAAIAIPNLYDMQLRAKLAEAPLNVDGILVSSTSYNADNDLYILHNVWHPDNDPAKTARPWTSGTNFDRLGWNPDGDVRCSYVVNSCNNGCIIGACGSACPIGECAVAHAECNVDGGGQRQCAWGGTGASPSQGVRWKYPPDTY